MDLLIWLSRPGNAEIITEQGSIKMIRTMSMTGEHQILQINDLDKNDNVRKEAEARRQIEERAQAIRDSKQPIASGSMSEQQRAIEQAKQYLSPSKATEVKLTDPSGPIAASGSVSGSMDNFCRQCGKSLHAEIVIEIVPEPDGSFLVRLPGGAVRVRPQVK